MKEEIVNAETGERINVAPPKGEAVDVEDLGKPVDKAGIMAKLKAAVMGNRLTESSPVPSKKVEIKRESVGATGTYPEDWGTKSKEDESKKEGVEEEGKKTA